MAWLVTVAAAIACGRDADPGLARGATVVVGTHQQALRPDVTNADFLPFSSLTRVGEAGEEVPHLARRWEDSADGRVRTWYLRTDIRWHDSEPFTAHDVKFTLDLLGQHGYAFNDVTVLNDSTVRIEVARHDYGADVVYYPRHLLEDEDPSRFPDWGFWERPVGTGPFRYVRGDPQLFMELEANPGYYRGKPKIERVIVKFVGEAAVPDALAGNIDIIYEANPGHWSQLESDGRFEAHHGIYPGGFALYFNHRHSLFADSRVRRAVAHAIDRRAILEALDLPRDLPLSDALWTRRQFRKGELAAPPTYDPAEAERLLDAAGWADSDGDGVRDRDGISASFTLTLRPDSRTRAVLVQEHLRRVGIAAELDQLDASLVWQRVENQEFDAAIHVLQPSQPWHNQYFGENALTGYENPEVARMLRQAMETSNLDRVDSLYLEMQDDLLREVPFVLLQPFNYSHFVHRRIRGLDGTVLMDPLERMDELWVEDERKPAKAVSDTRLEAAVDGLAGTVRILYAADERSFDPAMEDVPRFLYSSPLVRYEGGIQECGEPQPLLAESWEHSPDYRAWTIRLRPDAVWHDGVPVTAADLIFTFDLWTDPQIGHWAAGPLDSVVARDERTAAFYFQRPTGQLLNGWDLIYPKHLLENLDRSEFWSWEFWRDPVGNGPFRHVRSVAGNYSEFEANPDFVGGRPVADRILLKWGGNGLFELQAGNVDAVEGIPLGDAARLAADPAFQVYYLPNWGGVRIYWNQDHPILADVRVRRAITQAIDRRELLTALDIPADLPISDGLHTPCQWASGEISDPWPFNEVEAARLLESASWMDEDGDGIRERDGDDLSLTLLVPKDWLEAPRAAVFVQRELAQVGIALEVQSREMAVVADRLRSGDFEAALWITTPWPEGHAEWFGSRNPIGYGNAEVAELLDQAAAAVEQGQRNSIYVRLAELIRADLPATYLYSKVDAFAANRRVTGFGSAPGDLLMTADRLGRQEPRTGQEEPR